MAHVALFEGVFRFLENAGGGVETGGDAEVEVDAELMTPCDVRCGL